MVKPIAEMSGVYKSSGAKTLLADITFSIRRIGVTGFLGANGAGKTTTMEILSGCQGFDSGVVKIAGYCLQKQPAKARALIGYLPESPPVFEHLSIRESLSYIAQIRQLSYKCQKENIRWILNRLSLEGVSSQIVSSLSKGFRQRVGLAQALVHRPALMILDEPTDGLDPAQIKELRSFIGELGETGAVFLSSHLLSEVQAVCQDIMIIDRGKIRTQDSIQNLGPETQNIVTYVIAVNRHLTDFMAKLERIPLVIGTKRLNPQGDSIEFKFPVQQQERILNEIISLSLDGHHHLSLLQPRKNLEDVFLSMLESEKMKDLSQKLPN